MDVRVDSRVTFTKRELISNLIHYIRISYSVVSGANVNDSKRYYIYMNCRNSILLYFRVGILTFREEQLLDAIVKRMFDK